MEYLIYGMTIAIVLLGLIISYKIYVTRIDVHRKHYEIKWVLNQVERALAQLNSDQEATVLAGLQTLCVLNDVAAKMYAIPRVAELTRSTNPIIRKEARQTLMRISPQYYSPHTSLDHSPVDDHPQSDKRTRQLA